MTKRKDAPATYRALVGFNYPNPAGDGEIRVEAGDTGIELPEAVAASQLKVGAIAPEEKE